MIYADYNGSAPLLPEVKAYLIERLNGPFANPNAIHSLGSKILKGMEECRKKCAQVLGTTPNKIIFNSGSSEGITSVFNSVLQSTNRKKILISSVEHSAVLNVAEYYKNHGYEIVIIPCNENGILKIDFLNDYVEKNHQDIALVSIMAANNETGVIMPYLEISKICKKFGLVYFSDTTQFIGKTEFNFDEMGFDFAVVAGHKLGALTGTGILLVRDFKNFKPLIHGGGQEKGLRGGTQNYIGNETLTVSLLEFNKKKIMLNELRANRINFEKKIKNEFPEVVIIGENAERLAGTTLIGYPTLHGQAVQIELESSDVFVTTSSACSDNEPATSKVLKAMGINDNIGRSVIRISLSVENSKENYEKIFEALKKAYMKFIKKV
ncbi:MAG: cysteine desulfurase family protein [Bacteriovoracaceae bacterium]